MLSHKLMLPDGILVLEPQAPLEAADFAAVSREIDPYIAKYGKLRGLLLHTQEFPGWVNLEAVLAHMRFIETHHQQIERLAVVSDNALLVELPKIIGHLVHPEVKHFAESAYDDGLQWLKG